MTHDPTANGSIMADDSEPRSLEEELHEAIKGLELPAEESEAPAAEATPTEAPPVEEPTKEPVSETPAPTEGGAEPPALVKQRLDSTPKPTEEAKDEETSNALLGLIKDEFGEDYSGKYTDDTQLLQGLINATKLVGRKNDDASRWQQFQKDPEGYMEQWGYTKNGGDPNPPVQEAKQAPSDAVEFDENWMQMVERDASGAITGVKAGVDPTVATRLRKAEEFATKRYRDMIFSPEKIINPLLEKERETIREEVMTELNGNMAQQQSQALAWNWLNSDDNRKWIFQGGNPQSGLSPEGKQFAQYVDQGVSNRNIDPNNLQELVKFATDQMELDYFRSQNNQVAATASKEPPPAAMRTPNLAEPGAGDDVNIGDDESLEDAFFRLTGVKKQQY